MFTLRANTCRTKTKEKNNIGTGKDGGRVQCFAGSAAKVAGRGCGEKNRQRGREERGRYPPSRIACTHHRITCINMIQYIPSLG